MPPPVAGMASIRVDGYDIPLVFPVGDSGRARVPSHLPHVRFRFVESSIYVEEEQRSESGDVVQSIPVGKSAEAGTYAWHLPPGNYRAYGLPLSMLAASTEIHSRQSHNSTVDMPCSPYALLRSPRIEALGVPHAIAVLPVLKVERLEPIIELSSKSEGELGIVHGQQRSSSLRMASGHPDVVKSTSTTLSRTPCHSSLSVPPIEAYVLQRPSIMDCLLRLASMHRSRNELSTMDLSTMKHEQVPFLPLVFDGDVIFELPPCGPSSSASGAKNLKGMDKRYDGHLWCKLVTTNIHNSDNLKFRKSYSRLSGRPTSRMSDVLPKERTSSEIRTYPGVKAWRTAVFPGRPSANPTARRTEAAVPTGVRPSDRPAVARPSAPAVRYRRPPAVRRADCTADGLLRPPVVHCADGLQPHPRARQPSSAANGTLNGSIFR